MCPSREQETLHALLWPKGEREPASGIQVLEEREGGSPVYWTRHISIFPRLRPGILPPALSCQPVSMEISKALMDLLCTHSKKPQDNHSLKTVRGLGHSLDIRTDNGLHLLLCEWVFE